MRFPILVFLFTFSIHSFGQLPDEFFDQRVRSDFDFVVGLQFDATGQMYVWEKAGRLYVIDTLGNKSIEPVIDISEAVCDWKDHGLMSFALDPGFRNNGKVYLAYAVDLHHYYNYGTPAYSEDSTTINTATFGRIVQYQLDKATNFTQLVPDSEKILLGAQIENGIPLTNEFHGLGSLVMGEDGSLLVSVGDAASGKGPDTGGDSLGAFVTPALEHKILTEDQNIGSYRSLYLGSYNGKILRIDPETGEGLSSNPFFDTSEPRSPKSRIWATGFRNPYRIMIWPGTGSHYPADGNPGIIFAGDVGWGAWEELNVVTKGGQNFGWPITEAYVLAWAFYIIDAPGDQMMPNPLFGENGCDQPYYTFRDLIKGPKADLSNIKFKNPCNPNVDIPESLTTIITLPEIAWSNANWNKPGRVNIPIFNENGDPVGIPLSDERAYVEGEDFGGYSSMAGIYYDADLYPEQYRNKVFFMDHFGWIKVFEFNEIGNLVKVEPFHDRVKDIVHMALNPRDGAIYYVNIKNELHKIGYGGTPPPTAIISSDKNFGPSPLEVQLDGTTSLAPRSEIESYFWDFGNGVTSDEPKPNIVFTSEGGAITNYTVKLIVTGSTGLKDSTSQLISLNNTPPNVKITSIGAEEKYPLIESSLLRLEAEVSDQEHEMTSLTYEWKVFLHHNDHFHPEPILTSPNAYALISPLGCEEELYWYRIELTVTDPDGLVGTDKRLVYPYCGAPILGSIELEGQANLESVLLNWKVDQESAGLLYEIERSLDYFHFEKLGEIASDGSGSYSFTDMQPIRGVNLYRIRAKAENQAFQYSRIETVQFPAFPELYLYPNPVSTELNVFVQNTMEDKVKLTIYNPLGQIVFSNQWQVITNQEFQSVLMVDQWQNGIYYFTLENGDQVEKGPLMIAK